MNKVVSFDSIPDHYTADACVVWCFDDRFFKLLKAFGKQENFNHIDLVKEAGGAKALAGDPSPDRDFVINQIKTSARLHGTKRIILMTHRDCGAYGGSKNFSDADTERNHHAAELKKAEEFVKSEMPDATIESYFADFDGLYKI